MAVSNGALPLCKSRVAPVPFTTHAGNTKPTTRNFSAHPQADTSLLWHPSVYTVSRFHGDTDWEGRSLLEAFAVVSPPGSQGLPAGFRQGGPRTCPHSEEQIESEQDEERFHMISGVPGIVIGSLTKPSNLLLL